MSWLGVEVALENSGRESATESFSLFSFLLSALLGTPFAKSSSCLPDLPSSQVQTEHARVPRCFHPPQFESCVPSIEPMWHSHFSHQ